MYQIILLVHVLLAVALIVLVLIQQGKGATMGAGFGAGASGTVFGSQGSGSFLMKLTVSLAAGFFATSMFLGYLASASYKQAEALSLPAPSSQTAPVKLQTQIPAASKPLPSNSTSTKQ